MILDNRNKSIINPQANNSSKFVLGQSKKTMAMTNLEQTLQNIHIIEVNVTLPFDIVRLILQELYNIYYKTEKRPRNRE